MRDMHAIRGLHLMVGQQLNYVSSNVKKGSFLLLCRGFDGELYVGVYALCLHHNSQ